MDGCRPVPECEAGDADLSLLSYLDCCENAFLEYQKRVIEVDYQQSFHYLAFHTPFGGMVKGAHRSMMRTMTGAAPSEIEADFQQRVLPGMLYCQRVGNMMGATIFLSLASAIDYGQFASPKRVGCFSYGSGCCAEFYSGIVTAEGQKRQQRFQIERQLNERYQLSMDEYEVLMQGSGAVKFGTRNVTLDFPVIPGILEHVQELQARGGRPRLFLEEIRDFHRHYRWS
jgi:polyketide biosynthesis 3-hydroxy-3-methylglutaryl-CoA synthase-like enzyme PksG